MDLPLGVFQQCHFLVKAALPQVLASPGTRFPYSVFRGGGQVSKEPQGTAKHCIAGLGWAGPLHFVPILDSCLEETGA